MRILTVIYSMGCGGAERVMATLVNAWADRGHEVSLLTLRLEPSFYPLSPQVKYQPLGVAQASRSIADRWRNNVHRVRALRQQIRLSQPDVVVSFLDATNVVTLLTTRGLRVPVIVCEHNDPAYAACSRYWKVLRILTYPLASAVTVLTDNVLDQMRWLLRKRGLVMPNPIVLPIDCKDATPQRKAGNHLVAIGRLVPAKGFDYLLEAFRKLAPIHADWTLTILGEGPLRPALTEQIARLGLSGRVELRGRVEDPFRWLRAADLFVMSSRYEGFPCALGEALACGVAAVSFDCPSGPRAIIRDGVDGVLVSPGNVDALASALSRLMGDDVVRRRLSSRAPEVLTRFSLERILQRWDELFAQVGTGVHSSCTTPRCRETASVRS